MRPAHNSTKCKILSFSYPQEKRPVHMDRACLFRWCTILVEVIIWFFVFGYLVHAVPPHKILSQPLLCTVVFYCFVLFFWLFYNCFISTYFALLIKFLLLSFDLAEEVTYFPVFPLKNFIKHKTCWHSTSTLSTIGSICFLIFMMIIYKMFMHTGFIVL